jgi:hypothetical protein
VPVKRAAAQAAAQGDGAPATPSAQWAPARMADFTRGGAFFRAADRHAVSRCRIT